MSEKAIDSCEPRVPLRRLSLVVLAVLVLYRLFVLVALPTDQLIRYSNDDTCYYLGIGRNLAAGEGLTFDGLHRTNGFHPLWQLISTAPFLLGLGTDAAWRFLLALTVIIWGVGLWYLRRIILRRWGPAAALLALLVCLWPQIYNNSTCGMEVTLTFTLLMCGIDLLERRGIGKLNAPPGVEAGLGVLLALVFLSRLDTAFLHLAAGICFLRAYLRGGAAHGRGIRDLLARGLRLFGPTALALAGYLVWNKLSFGHFFAISGALKSSFPIPGFNLGQFLMYRELGVFAVAALIWLAVRRRSNEPWLRILAWGLAGQLLYLLFFLKWAPFAYYLIALGLPVGLFALADFQNRLLPVDGRLYRWLVPLATVVVIAGQVLSWYRQGYGFQRATYEGALWARDNTSEDAVLAMRDSGIFGYFCERSCINLDGLVNDYEYQRWVSADRLGDYFDENGVDYFVHHALPTEDHESRETLSFYIPGRLYGGEAIYVLSNDDLVFTSRPYRYGFGMSSLTLGIWRLGQ